MSEMPELLERIDVPAVNYPAKSLKFWFIRLKGARSHVTGRKVESDLRSGSTKGAHRSHFPYTVEFVAT